MLSDTEIKTQIGMIDPFLDHSVKEEAGKKVISYGLSSYGYDVRLASHLQVFEEWHNHSHPGVDPKEFDHRVLRGTNPSLYRGSVVLALPPHSAALTSTLEYIKMPKDVSAICMGKSTYARCGLIVNTTPIEAGWEGNITIELFNTTPYNIFLYPGEGIAQLQFFKCNPCEKAYNERSGKYQSQVGITGAIV